MIDHSLWPRIIFGVCESLISREDVAKELISIYKSDVNRFFTAAKSSEMYTGSFMTHGSLERETNLKRVMGVVLIADEDMSIKEQLLAVLSQHYFLLYKSVIDGIFIEYPINHDSDKGSVYNEFWWNHIYYYLIRLIYTENKPMSIRFYNLIHDIEQNNREHDITCEEYRFYIEKRKKEYRPFIRKCKRMFTDIRNWDDITNIYLDNMLSQIDKNNTSTAIAANVHAYISNILREQNINASVLLNGISVDSSVQEFIFTEISTFSESLEAALYSIPDNEISLFYIIGLLTETFGKIYANAKAFYNSNNQETVFLDFDLERRAYNKEIDTLKSQLLRSSEIERKYNDILYQLTIKNEGEARDSIGIVRKQEKEIEKLKQQLIEEEEKSIELNALRSFMFQQAQSSYVLIESDDIQENQILSNSFLIIGGALSWQNKVRNQYPSATVIKGDNTSFDLNLISNVDYVFLNIVDMCHAAYYRIIEHIRKHKINYSYINTINIEKVDLQIRTVLNKINQ